MRAVRVREFGVVETAGIENVSDPDPGPGEVLVEVHAAPVNYVDHLTFSGLYQFKPALPYTPGKGPAGVVRSVGAGVTAVAPGHRVLAMAEYGGYAELAVAPEAQVYRLPDRMSFVDAAAMALGFDTSWMALRDRARLEPGESVLVLGATGAVGGAAVQLAKAMGAGTVIAGVSSPDRFADVAAGADAVVDLSREPLRDTIRAQVDDATGGSGVDVVIDPLGGDAFDGSVRALAWRGRLVVIGFAAGRIPTLRVNYLLLKNIEVSGLQISDYRKRAPELMGQCYREVFAFYDAGAVTAPQTHTVPLDAWATALDAVAQRTARARVVLLPR